MKPEVDLVFVDGVWLQTASLQAVADALRRVVLQGTPIVILAGSPEVVRLATEGLEVAQAYVDSPVLAYGLKYYPTAGAGSGLNVAGVLGEPGQLEGAVAYAYSWGVKYLSNTSPNP